MSQNNHISNYTLSVSVHFSHQFISIFEILSGEEIFFFVQVSGPLIWTQYCYIYRCLLANFREHLPLIISELYEDGFTNLVWAAMSAVHCTAFRPARGRVRDGAEVTAASASFPLGRLWLQLDFHIQDGPTFHMHTEDIKSMSNIDAIILQRKFVE